MPLAQPTAASQIGAADWVSRAHPLLKVLPDLPVEQLVGQGIEPPTGSLQAPLQLAQQLNRYLDAWVVLSEDGSYESQEFAAFSLAARSQA
jgi:hypothetical protein